MSDCKNIIKKVTEIIKANEQKAKHIWTGEYWQEIFEILQKCLDCDRITIRVCGDELSGDKLKKFKHPGKGTGHRILLAHHGYAYPQEDTGFAGPLSSLKEKWFLSDEITIIQDLSKPTDKLSEKERTLLDGLEFHSWIGFGLHYDERLVGVMTIDYINKPTKVPDECKEMLKELGKLVAETIHEAYEKRKKDLKKKIEDIADEHYELFELFDRITSGIIEYINKGRVLLNSCEIFREDQQDSSKIMMKRWHPQDQERVLKGESVAYQAREHAIIEYDLSNTDKQKTTDSLRSILAVPIRTNKDVIAVITVNSYKPNIFCWYDVELIEEAIKSAKVAIERNWILDSLHRVIMDGLYQVDRDAISKMLFDALKELIGFETGFIALISDKQNQNREVVYAYPHDTTRDLNSIPLDIIEGINKRNEVVDCKFRDTLQAIAIQFDGYMLGGLFFKLRSELNNAKKLLLKRLTSYLGLAFYHYHIQQLQQQFEESCLRVLECSTFQASLEMIARMARELMDGIASYVVLVEPNGIDLRIVATSFRTGYCAKPKEGWPHLNLDGRDGKKISLTGAVIKNRQLILLNDVPNECQYRAYKDLHIGIPICKCDEQKEQKIQSELAVAMLIRDQKREPVAGIPAWGAINVQHESKGHFRDFHKQIIKKFATLAATVVKKYNFPAHPHFNVDQDATKDTDIFFALKFSPEERRRNLDEWVKKAVESATKNDNGKDSKQERHLTVKSADISGAIGSGVWTYIARCEILIADMSGDSVNVFYEIGLAHALNKHVILICDKNTMPPTDLAGISYVQYYYNEKQDDNPEKQEFIENLAREIRKLAVPNPPTCASICDCS